MGRTVKQPRVDPVLRALGEAEAAYRSEQARHEQTVLALRAARAELAKVQRARERTSQRLRAARAEMTAERQRAAQEREQSDRLRAALREIHRALFSGDIHDLVLRACLQLTGATRGLYLTARGPAPRLLRVRAAIDISAQVGMEPPDQIESLARQVLDESQTRVINHDRERKDLPDPVDGYRNYVAAPVSLLGEVDGVIFVADRAHGSFRREDIDALLSVGEQASVAVENWHLRQRLEAAYVATITALADAVEAKDPYTHGHCERVAHLARLTALRLGLGTEEVSHACYGGLLHDVGKIGVSDGVLNKPGPLLPEELELVRSHVRIGHDLLRKVPALSVISQVVLRHHEWYDGHGYPDGLRGQQIPTAARIVAVADAYSAMVDQRSYKEARTEPFARSELVRCAGTQFDPAVVEAFLSVLDNPLARLWDDDEAGCALLPGLEAVLQRGDALLVAA